MTGSSDAAPGAGATPRRRVLLLAFAATFLSRAVAGAVVESLRAELWLTDQALGTLVSVFAGAYALGLPAGAVVPARGKRAGLLAAGLGLCGAATAASAAAGGFWWLVATRVAAGAGAGIATGAGLILLLDGRRWPREGLRGLFLPAAAGLALGYVLGGLCDRTPGWRGAFASSGTVSILLGAAALRYTAPASHAVEPWTPLRAEGWSHALRRLAADPARVLAVAAAVAGAAAASALAFWLPAFLERTRGVPRLVAGVQLGVAVLASGFAGAALGRAASERPRAQPTAGAWTAAAGAAAAALAMGVALAVSSQAVVLPALMVALLAVSASARGAVSALRGDGSDPALVAVALLLAHGAGEVAGAFAVGVVADRFSFGHALYLLPASLAAAAILWGAAALAARRARATTTEAGRQLA